ERAVRDLVLARRGELGHRDGFAARTEHRVVPEAAAAARRSEDLAAAFAARRLDRAFGRDERGHAYEARAARARARELGQQPSTAVPTGAPRPAVARRERAGPAGERVHLEPGIVGERRATGGERDRARLRGGVGGVVVAFVGHLHVGEFSERAQRDARAGEDLADLAQLARIPGRDHELGPARGGICWSSLTHPMAFARLRLAARSLRSPRATCGQIAAPATARDW